MVRPRSCSYMQVNWFHSIGTTIFGLIVCFLLVHFLTSWSIQARKMSPLKSCSHYWTHWITSPTPKLLGWDLVMRKRELFLLLPVSQQIKDNSSLTIMVQRLVYRNCKDWNMALADFALFWTCSPMKNVSCIDSSINAGSDKQSNSAFGLWLLLPSEYLHHGDGRMDTNTMVHSTMNTTILLSNPTFRKIQMGQSSWASFHKRISYPAMMIHCWIMCTDNQPPTLFGNSCEYSWWMRLKSAITPIVRMPACLILSDIATSLPCLTPPNPCFNSSWWMCKGSL